MACRSGIPEAGEDVRRDSGGSVEMLHVDLSDFDSVRRLCDELADRRIRLDVTVLNAGVMPRRSSRTRYGLELMFQVNFLSSVLLTQRLLQDGVIPNRTFAHGEQASPRPRIIFVSSETHRSAKPLDPATLGRYVEYNALTGMAQYAHTKLAICTYATELGRRLRDANGVDVAVHSLCPGPVDSNLAREAPAPIKPVLKLVMRTFFARPEVAARPVVYLACAQALEGQTGRYMHMMKTKEPSAAARDLKSGQHLWEASKQILHRTSANSVDGLANG
jgi:NAD(P)-dependent dehydrogenase (short-subunit alcohol dehydrogenase family)